MLKDNRDGIGYMVLQASLLTIVAVIAMLLLTSCASPPVQHVVLDKVFGCRNVYRYEHKYFERVSHHQTNYYPRGRPVEVQIGRTCDFQVRGDPEVYTAPAHKVEHLEPGQPIALQVKG